MCGRRRACSCRLCFHMCRRAGKACSRRAAGCNTRLALQCCSCLPACPVCQHFLTSHREGATFLFAAHAWSQLRGSLPTWTSRGTLRPCQAHLPFPGATNIRACLPACLAGWPLRRCMAGCGARQTTLLVRARLTCRRCRPRPKGAACHARGKNRNPGGGILSVGRACCSPPLLCRARHQWQGGTAAHRRVSQRCCPAGQGLQCYILETGASPSGSHSAASTSAMQVLERGTRQVVEVPLSKGGRELGSVELCISHRAMPDKA